MNAEASAEQSTIEQTVAEAQMGDTQALERVLRFCQEPIYNLALRMVWNPTDAEDATQEILIKIVTHLSQFRGASRFTTWIYRIATNHLLTLRQQRAERSDITFAALRALHGEATVPEPSVPDSADEALQLAEITRQCTLGMLLRLDREQRIAYILGEVFEVPSEQGAQITETTPATYRKRLSRARLRLRAFLAERCGLVNPALTCQCGGGGVCSSAEPADAEASIEQAIGDWQHIYRIAAIYRGHPRAEPPDALIRQVRGFFAHSGLTLFES
jgi:RNA polymerase sigma factor (sigma-70 family)